MKWQWVVSMRRLVILEQIMLEIVVLKVLKISESKLFEHFMQRRKLMIADFVPNEV